MKINDEQWDRITADVNVGYEHEFIEVGSWMDRSANEVLLQHIKTKQLYRRRFWFKSSSLPAGEVWFRFKA